MHVSTFKPKIELKKQPCSTTCTKAFPNNDIMGIPYNTYNGAILFNIASIIYYFRIQTIIPL